MTRKHRFKSPRWSKTTEGKKEEVDASYEDGDNWEFAREKFPVKIKRSLSPSQPKPEFGSVDAPQS